MKTGKKLIVGYLVLATAAFFFGLWIFLGFGDKRQRLGVENTKLLHGQYEQTENVRSWTSSLPEDFNEERFLLFKTTHTRVEVLAGENIIYRYGWEESAPRFLKSPGTLWHVVSVPADSGEKSLTLRIYSVYEDFFGDTPMVRYGTQGECVLQLLSDAGLILIINCIIIFAGILSIFLHIATRKRKRNDGIGSFLCMGFFALIIAVWSLCQSGILQFLIPDGRTLYFVDLFTFFLFPVPFNLFVYHMFQTKYRKGFAILVMAYFINMIIEAAIQLTGWRDIFEMISVTHVLMAINVVYMILAVWREIRISGNIMAKRFQVPLYIISVLAAAELIAYYMNDFRKTSVFLPIGTILFICMLIWIQVSQYYRSLMEEEKLLYFEKLANIDMLTEALNRNAYENMLKGIEKQTAEQHIGSVVMFDVNDMKYINDNFGHEKGDEALQLCYHCICEIFSHMGKCYRIGGDEFVLLAYSSEGLEAEIKRFEQLVELRKNSINFPFSIALGYAYYDPGQDEDLKDTIRRSDEMMYLDKKKKKQHE